MVALVAWLGCDNKGKLGKIYICSLLKFIKLCLNCGPWKNITLRTKKLSAADMYSHDSQLLLKNGKPFFQLPMFELEIFHFSAVADNLKKFYWTSYFFRAKNCSLQFEI
jgi:hypothetical protein